MKARSGWGLVLLLLVTACGSPRQAPAPPPAPSGELIFTTTATGSHRVLASADGSLVSDLGPGPFVYTLTDGGDLDEAYLIGSEPDGIRRVKAGRPLSVTKIASGPPAGALSAALVPAPGLTSYVGRPSVLIVRGGDGSLAGYQAGRLLWRLPPGTAGGLLQRGSLAFATGTPQTALVQPETGALTPVGGPGCEPAGDEDGKAVLACLTGASLSIAGQRVPGQHGTGSPLPFHPVRRPDLYLYWPFDGLLCHLAGVLHCSAATASPQLGRAAFTPDGKVLFVPSRDEIVEQQTAGGGEPRRFKAGESYRALASSRDGSYLYAAGGDHLDVWSLGSGPARTRRYPADAADIELVAGG